jgi:hypothetical protein
MYLHMLSVASFNILTFMRTRIYGPARSGAGPWHLSRGDRVAHNCKDELSERIRINHEGQCTVRVSLSVVVSGVSMYVCARSKLLT